MDLKKIYSIARAYKSYNDFKSHIDNEIHNHPVTATSDYKYKLIQDGGLSDVKLSLPDKRKIVEAYQQYDKSCHSSHTSGEEPSYHYRNGIEWLLFRIKESIKKQ